VDSVLSGSLENWRLIQYHAEERNNPFARALAAFCIREADNNANILRQDDTSVESDYAFTLSYLQQKALETCRYSQFYLGFFYEVGLGVVQDDCEAVKYYDLSAQQGNAKAQCFLATSNEYGWDQDYDEAVRLHRLSAEQGFALAQCRLGNCYYNGHGVEVNFVEGARLFRLAAAQNFAPGQYLLAMSHLSGIGVESDVGEAIRLFRLSADQNYAAAQCQLARCCDNGYGSSDFDVATESTRLYRLAAEQNDANALFILASKHLEGAEAEQAEGIRLLKRAADKCHVPALELLAEHYTFGTCGVEIDFVEAASCFRIAAMKGSMEAQYCMGICHLAARGIVRSNTYAVYWLNRAADKDYEPAILELYKMEVEADDIV
jgi:TPR repeat protein